MKNKEIALEIEELEERIAPSSLGAANASSTGKSHGSTPEVPAGARLLDYRTRPAHRPGPRARPLRSALCDRVAGATTGWRRDRSDPGWSSGGTGCQRKRRPSPN